MKQGTFLSIEDTFFGAILGAIFGIFVDKLPIGYVLLIVSFFIVFPLILRRVESVSIYYQSLVLLLGLAWMIVLVFDLNGQTLIPLFNNGLIFLGIFFGWLISLFTRFLAK